MMHYVKNIVIAVLCIIALTGCEQSKPCIDADDFGFPKITLNGEGIDVEGQDENQVSKWKDSALVIDGSQVIFDVYGRWFPWLQGDSAIVRDTCLYNENIEYPYSTGDESDDSGIEVNRFSQPCWLGKGMGVYGLTVTTDGSGNANLPATDTDESGDTNPPTTYNYISLQNPNSSTTTRRFPASANSFHMGDPNTNDLTPTRTFDIDSDPGGGAVEQGIRVGTSNMLGEPNKTKIGDRLYFKILDTFYADNGGSVVVKIRSGARSPYPGVFEKMINAVSDILLGSAEVIFRQLLDPDRSSIPRAIHALLILYIALYGLYYMMGMVSPDTTQAVFLTKILKFGMVAALISGSSYEFFYDNLLILFTDGMKQIINIISGPFLTGSATATDRLTFFDDVFEKLFSEETNIKIASLMWYPNPDDYWVASFNIKGLLYIPVLYILIAFFAIALLKALLVYLMALIALGMLIALAPILIPFLLFSKTKELYEGWLKALIGTAIQPILLFAFLTLLYIILMESLYKTLGYRVCWDTWWSGSLFGNGGFIDIADHISQSNTFKAWMPNIRDKWDAILIPPFYYNDVTTIGCTVGDTVNIGDGVDQFLDIDCNKVGEKCRLVDYPSLIPENSDKCPNAPVEDYSGSDNDKDKLKKAINGSVTSFEDIFFFGITIFLMYLFSDKVPAIARDIAGLTHGASLESAAGGLWGNVKSIGSNPLGVRSILGAAGTGARRAAGIGSLSKGFRNWQGKVGGAYDGGKGRFKKGMARGALKVTSTEGAARTIKGWHKEGKKDIHGIQDAVGSRLEKADKYTGVSGTVKVPYKAAKTIPGAKKVFNAGEKSAGFMKPTNLAEKVGGLGGKLLGTIAYGRNKKAESPRKLLAGSTGDITTRADIQKDVKGLGTLLNTSKDLTPDQRKALETEKEKLEQKLASLPSEQRALEAVIEEEKLKKEKLEQEEKVRIERDSVAEAHVTEQQEKERKDKEIQELETREREHREIDEQIKTLTERQAKLDLGKPEEAKQFDEFSQELERLQVKTKALEGAGMFAKDDPLAAQKAEREKSATRTLKKQQIDAKVNEINVRIKSLDPKLDKQKIDDLKRELFNLKIDGSKLD